MFIGHFGTALEAKKIAPQPSLGTLILESLVFFGGVYLVVKTTEALNKKGVYGLWSMVGLLFLIYLVNMFGPPPPSADPIPLVGMLQWIFVAWGYWIDRNRKALLA